MMGRSSFQGGRWASVCQRPAQQILRPLDPHEDCRSFAFGIAVLLRLNQTIPDALRNGIVLMDRRFAIEARYATCRKDASGHQLWIMEIDGHLRTIDQTGCGASSAPIQERNVERKSTRLNSSH